MLNILEHFFASPRSESTHQWYIDAYSHIMATEFEIDAFNCPENHWLLNVREDEGTLLLGASLLCDRFFLVFSDE